SSFLLLSFSIILPYLIVDLKLCNRTIKNLKLERDDLRDTLYKVDKNIQYYQKSEQRLEAYQKNQSSKHKARDDDFEI
ncbi:hypothetical protein P7H66_13350, partial [Lactococcus lactis]|nr:hypothetical protein [Lactococcus lactis]